MQHIRKLSRSFKQRLKPILNIWQSIQKFIEQLPQLLQDTILVISLIILLGTSGWIEYNFKPFTNPKSEYLPITLRSIPSLKENTESVLRPSSSRITSLAFNPSGTNLVSGSADGTIKRWNMQTVPIQQINTDCKDQKRIWSLTFIPDINILVGVNQEGEINFCSISSKLNNKENKLPETISFKPNNTVSNNTKNQSTIALKEEHASENPIYPFVFSPEGQLLASDWSSQFNGHSSSGLNLKLWQYKKEEDTYKFEELIVDKSNESKDTCKELNQKVSQDGLNNSLIIDAIAFNKNSDIVASAHRDGIIRLWLVKSNKNKFSCIDELKGRKVVDEKASAESKDAKIFVLTFLYQNDDSPSLGKREKRYLLSSGSDDGMIKLWKFQLKDEKLKAEKPISLEHPKAITSLAFSHNGQILASGSDDGTIKLWNLSKVWKLSTVEEIRTLRSHPDAVTSLVFSPDDKILASGSDDETIKIWQANSQIRKGWRQPPMLRLSTMSF